MLMIQMQPIEKKTKRQTEKENDDVSIDSAI